MANYLNLLLIRRWGAGEWSAAADVRIRRRGGMTDGRAVTRPESDRRTVHASRGSTPRPGRGIPGRGATHCLQPRSEPAVAGVTAAASCQGSTLSWPAQGGSIDQRHRQLTSLPTAFPCDPGSGTSGVSVPPRLPDKSASCLPKMRKRPQPREVLPIRSPLPITSIASLDTDNAMTPSAPRAPTEHSRLG